MRLEHEDDYAKKGVAGTALGLSIGALGVEALRGGLGNLFSGAGNCGDNHGVSQREAALSAQIAALENEVKLRDANTFTMGEMNNLRNYVDRKFECIEHELCDQRVYNATNNAALGCIQNQVAQLAALTKTVIPASSICPPVMPLYNSWTAPTTPATTG